MAAQQWFVVVSRKAAKVFEVDPAQETLGYIKSIQNPLGREKNKSMSTDKPGVSRGKLMRGSPHNLATEKSPHEDAAIEFARKLSHQLKAYGHDHVFTHLTIAAEPHMMGLIKKAMQHDKVKFEVNWVKKDLEKMSTSRLESVLFKASKSA